jgi:hypothetical protein
MFYERELCPLEKFEEENRDGWIPLFKSMFSGDKGKWREE